MRLLSVLALGILILAPGDRARAAPIKLKIATIMPRGSPWTNALARLATAVKKRTQGQVVLKVYYGAVAGTERRAAARMAANQLQGMAAAAVGLTSIDKTLRLLELPMLFRSFKEYLYVAASLKPVFAKRLAKRGYRLLAIAAMGWVHLYSKTKLRTFADVRARKHWTWKHDPTAAAFFKALGARAQKLPITDVLQSLQSNLIDTVYGMPHAVQVLQWHTSVSWVLRFPVTMSIACLVVRADALDRLTPAQRKVVVSEARALERRLNRASRTINQKSLGAMIKGGLRSLTPSPRLKARLRALRPKIWRLLRGVTYLPGDLKKVKALLAVCRSTSCTP